MMLQHLFDTDHLTLFDHRHATLRHRFAAAPAGSVAISPATIQEYLKGRLAALSRHSSGPRQVQAYAKLVSSVLLFQQFPIVPFDTACDRQLQQLRSLLPRLGTQDLKIAAAALVHKLVLLSRNRRDFAQIPGLTLAYWSV
ncbi:MAG: type II toxin-antitoxin system VapC family toxin [Gemmataceae bacterium]